MCYKYYNYKAYYCQSTLYLSLYFILTKSTSINIIEVIGTEITIPQTPNNPPPIIIEIKTISGLRPVLSPINFGAKILFQPIELKQIK